MMIGVMKRQSENEENKKKTLRNEVDVTNWEVGYKERTIERTLFAKDMVEYNELTC